MVIAQVGVDRAPAADGSSRFSDHVVLRAWPGTVDRARCGFGPPFIARTWELSISASDQSMQALVRAFPPGADHPELALVRAMGDLAQGRLDEAAAHLAVAGVHAGTAAAGRRRRLQVAVASLRLSLARRRGDLAGVIEQARFLASPVTGEADEDIALGSDLRARQLRLLAAAGRTR